MTESSSKKPRVSAVAALGKNRVLGRDNELIWHIPDDMKRFKRLTLGHPVIMGRKTFDSILAGLGTPLPGRANIVVTRDASWYHPGAMVTHSIESALTTAGALDGEEVFVIGGGQIYEAALPMTDRLYLTLIEDTQDGDAYFPAYEETFTNEIERETRDHNGLMYTWVDLERP